MVIAQCAPRSQSTSADAESVAFSAGALEQTKLVGHSVALCTNGWEPSTLYLFYSCGGGRFLESVFKVSGVNQMNWVNRTK